MKGGVVEITASYPAGAIETTSRNLKEAAEGERLEWGTLYPNFADIADQEGFPEIAESFREIAKVEAYHERRYRKILTNIENGQVFRKDNVVKWKCRNCGYVFEGKEPPQECPACKHPQSYYELWMENY